MRALEAALLETEGHFGIFLRTREGALPTLTDVRASLDGFRGDLHCRASFREERDFGWVLRRPDLGYGRSRAITDFGLRCRDVYWRLYEDERMRRALAPGRDEVRALENADAPAHVIHEARRRQHAFTEHYLGHHVSRNAPQYFGVDIGRDEGTATASRDNAGTLSLRELVDSMRWLTAVPPDLMVERRSEAYRRAVDDMIVFGSGVFFIDELQADPEAEARGLALLKSWLSPEQLASYEKNQHFEVTGYHSGKRYRIHKGRQMNIHELNRKGRAVHGWCFLPQGGLVEGDVMLAQKIALETDERGALKVANRFDPRRRNDVMIVDEFVSDNDVDLRPGAVNWVSGYSAGFVDDTPALQRAVYGESPLRSLRTWDRVVSIANPT